MKQKVTYSILSKIITAAVLLLFVIGIISLWGDMEKLVLFIIIAAATTLVSMYYCPVSVEATESGVKINRLLSKPKFFPYADIHTAETCYPSAGGLRLCGCGGFMGYWGYFHDTMIGTFFGYYGSRNHCFALKLKSGQQYVIGCSNAPAMVKYIASKYES